jgi:hypothetical protein
LHFLKEEGTTTQKFIFKKFKKPSMKNLLCIIIPLSFFLLSCSGSGGSKASSNSSEIENLITWHKKAENKRKKIQEKYSPIKRSKYITEYMKARIPQMEKEERYLQSLQHLTSTEISKPLISITDKYTMVKEKFYNVSELWKKIQSTEGFDPKSAEIQILMGKVQEALSEESTIAWKCLQAIYKVH